MNERENLLGASTPRLWMTMALGLGLIGGVWLDRLATIGWPGSGGSVNIRLIDEAWRDIRLHFVERAQLSPTTVTYGALSGMVDSLGDTGHSRFLSPELVKQLAELEKNRFQGVGAEVRMKNGHVVIVAPLPGSPAMRAGLKPGDIILKVNGEDVAGQPLDQVVQRIGGPAGTVVALTILSPATERTREVRLTRAAITIHDVAWEQLPGTTLADVHLAGFNKDCGIELKKTLSDIARQHLTGIVLDLRNNPGGLLDQAVDVASQFLASGHVLQIKNAAGKIKDVPVEHGVVATTLPLVVLINEGTASAAEIVAGALQDAHRGPLVGEKTFGTGTVLGEFPLSDGSAILLAVEEWLTPSGHVIWHKGITPNVLVPLPENVNPVFPELERHWSAAQLRDTHDAQLLRAIELLESKPGAA
jgi:carboxyl-terminal processing protease